MLGSSVRNAGVSIVVFMGLLGCAGGDDEPSEDSGSLPPGQDAATMDSSVVDPHERDGALADASQPLDSAVSSDAEPVDASGSLCVVSSIEVTSNGGLVAYRDRAILEPCNTVRFERLDPDGTMIESCSGTIAQSPDPTGSINTIVLDDDVQDALRDAPITFGNDRRFIDVPITQLVINHKVIEVGAPCEDAGSDCRPIPAGIERLMNALGELFEAQIAQTPSCAPFAL